jgi:hypothetical protein
VSAPDGRMRNTEVTGSLSAASFVLAGGTFTQSAGNVTTGDFLLNSGTRYELNSGNLNVAGQMSLLGTLVNGGGSLNLAGTSTFSVPFGATVNWPGNFTPAGGTTRVDGWLIVEGNVQLSEGLFLGTGKVTVNNGAGFFNVGAATLSSGSSPGALTIDGNLTLDALSTLLVEIGGSTAGVDYDLLNVTGLATLDGTLQLASWNAYDPIAGEGFVPLTYGSVSGDFAALDSAFTLAFTYSVGADALQLLTGGYSVVVPAEVLIAAEEPSLVIQDANVMADTSGDLLEDFESETTLAEEVLEEESSGEDDSVAVGSGALEGADSDDPVSQFCSG